jgi:hypothetical protein
LTKDIIKKQEIKHKQYTRDFLNSCAVEEISDDVVFEENDISHEELDNLDGNKKFLKFVDQFKKMTELNNNQILDENVLDSKIKTDIPYKINIDSKSKMNDSNRINIDSKSKMNDSTKDECELKTITIDEFKLLNEKLKVIEKLDDEGKFDEFEDFEEQSVEDIEKEIAMLKNNIITLQFEINKHKAKPFLTPEILAENKRLIQQWNKMINILEQDKRKLTS